MGPLCSGDHMLAAGCRPFDISYLKRAISNFALLDFMREDQSGHDMVAIHLGSTSDICCYRFSSLIGANSEFTNREVQEDHAKRNGGLRCC